jgi:hypothetical protein
MFENANCITENPELHFPLETDTAGIRKAKAICKGCPCLSDCLREAMEAETGGTQYRFGIYAGLTPRERADLARRSGAVA